MIYLFYDFGLSFKTMDENGRPLTVDEQIESIDKKKKKRLNIDFKIKI